jgi:hypothetical protein
MGAQFRFDVRHPEAIIKDFWLIFNNM